MARFFRRRKFCRFSAEGVSQIDYKDILAMNEMYEFMSKLDTMRKGIHPLRTLWHQLQRIEPFLK